MKRTKKTASVEVDGEHNSHAKYGFLKYRTIRLRWDHDLNVIILTIFLSLYTLLPVLEMTKQNHLILLEVFPRVSLYNIILQFFLNSYQNLCFRHALSISTTVLHNNFDC